MMQALEDARLEPRVVDYINAHGTSTPANDAVEAKAISRIWPVKKEMPLVSSTKSLIGHTLGAAGAVEAVAVIKALEEDRVHPGINLLHPDAARDLNHVGAMARQAEVRAALKNSFAFGGQNAPLVLRRYEQEPGCPS